MTFRFPTTGTTRPCHCLLAGIRIVLLLFLFLVGALENSLGLEPGTPAPDLTAQTWQFVPDGAPDPWKAAEGKIRIVAYLDGTSLGSLVFEHATALLDPKLVARFGIAQMVFPVTTLTNKGFTLPKIPIAEDRNRRLRRLLTTNRPSATGGWLFAFGTNNLLAWTGELHDGHRLQQRILTGKLEPEDVSRSRRNAVETFKQLWAKPPPPDENPAVFLVRSLFYAADEAFRIEFRPHEALLLCDEALSLARKHYIGRQIEMDDAMPEIESRILTLLAEMGNQIPQTSSGIKDGYEIGNRNLEMFLPTNHPNRRFDRTLPSTTNPPAPRVIGYWKAEPGTFTNKIGQAIQYHLAGQAAPPKPLRYGTSKALGYSTGMFDPPFAVMAFPALSPHEGIWLPLDFEPNGGGRFLNQYTLIVDFCADPPMTSTARPRAYFPILQTYHTNNNDCELFLLFEEPAIAPKFQAKWYGELHNFVVDRFPRAHGGMGIRGIYHGSIPRRHWTRLVLAVDLTQSVTNYFKYVQGLPVGAQQVHSGTGIDSRFALRPINQIFSDNDLETSPGAVSAIQIRNYPMTPAEIAEMGAFSPDGIPTAIRPRQNSP